MKILHINTRLKGGGGASYIANLLYRKIEDIDIEMFFLYGRGNYSNKKEEIKITDDINQYTSYLSNLLIGKEINIFFKKKVIEKYIIEADVVHIHNLHGYYIDYVWLIEMLIKHDKKVIWTLHDLWILTGRCAFMYSDKDCNEWRSNCEKCNYKYLYPKTLRDIASKNLSEKRDIINSINKSNIVFVTPSNWVKSLIQQSYLSEFNVISIPNCIEINKQSINKIKSKEEVNININKITCLLVAADINAKRKGILDFLNYIDRLDKNIEIITVGEKVPENTRNIHRVKQLGYITDREKLYKIYEASDIFVNPAYSETFSLTTLESIANGTPVVSFDLPPLIEIIGEDCGETVEKGNFLGIIQKINYLAKNPQLLKEMSKKSLKRYKQKYDVKKSLEAYFTEYCKLCNEESKND